MKNIDFNRLNWTDSHLKIGLGLALITALFLSAITFYFWGVVTNYQNNTTGSAIGSSGNYTGKKILYIDSYHEGYEWSDGITSGIRSVLEKTNADFQIYRMDTKRRTDEPFKKESALAAKAAIEEFNPDVVIVSDDNAFKYLVQPYYKDSELPFVFSGLNWDASVYEAPYTNTTGMVEISLTIELIEMLQEYARGDRVGYLSADVLTERKNEEYYKKLFNLEFEKTYFVLTMEEWEDAFLNLQEEVDVIIFENNAGITDWNDERARVFALNNTTIPVGTTNPWTMQSSLIGLTKIPDEQGIWSAEAALRILDGQKPSEIPVVTNKRGELFVNLALAEKLGIALRTDVLKNAQVIK